VGLRDDTKAEGNVNATSICRENTSLTTECNVDKAQTTNGEKKTLLIDDPESYLIRASQAHDIWSLALVMYELCSGMKFFIQVDTTSIWCCLTINSFCL
jgi:serine/threonine protein kinase